MLAINLSYLCYYYSKINDNDNDRKLSEYLYSFMNINCSSVNMMNGHVPIHVGVMHIIRCFMAIYEIVIIAGHDL